MLENSTTGRANVCSVARIEVLNCLGSTLALPRRACATFLRFLDATIFGSLVLHGSRGFLLDCHCVGRIRGILWARARFRTRGANITEGGLRHTSTEVVVAIDGHFSSWLPRNSVQSLVADAVM